VSQASSARPPARPPYLNIAAWYPLPSPQCLSARARELNCGAVAAQQIPGVVSIGRGVHGSVAPRTVLCHPRETSPCQARRPNDVLRIVWGVAGRPPDQAQTLPEAIHRDGRARAMLCVQQAVAHLDSCGLVTWETVLPRHVPTRRQALDAVR
jgi:hypothetical protein